MNNDILDLNGIMLIGALLLTSALWIFAMSFLKRKRDEREEQALSKATFLTVNNMAVIAIMYGMMAFANGSFLIPTWHVFTLITLALIMMSLMYRIYLVKDNLEPSFISRMPKERKVNFYRIIVYSINLGVLICTLMLRFTDGFQFKLNIMSLVMFWYISYIIHINTPNKKIINTAESNKINLLLLIITLVISVYLLLDKVQIAKSILGSFETILGQ